MTTIFVKNAADKGRGSLRAAIEAARSGDIIKFSEKLSGQTIRLTSGDIDIKQNITIDGSGLSNITLSGSQRSRIFRIDKYKHATIKGITFRNGREVVAGSQVGKGGAILVSDYGGLTLENSRFIRNVAERGGAIQVGYGAKATVLGSTFNRNDGSVSSDGFSAGAIATAGAGVGSDRGFLVIKNSRFLNNKGATGGAVYVLQGPLTIQDSVIRGNIANSGGGIFTDGGPVTVQRSVVQNNKSEGPGGGLFVWAYRDEKILIEDSVLRGNSTAQNKGGGARIGPGGMLTVKGSTIADNSAYQQGGGLWLDSRESVNIRHTTFSNNAAIKGVGGAIALNTKSGTPVDISHSTFVDHTSGQDSKTIWLNSNNQKDIVLTNTVFSGKGSVNYTMQDGGGNYATFTTAGRPITDKAVYLDDLGLSSRQQVGDHVVYVPLVGSPLIRRGKDIGAVDADQISQAALQLSQPSIQQSATLVVNVVADNAEALSAQPLLSNDTSDRTASLIRSATAQQSTVVKSSNADEISTIGSQSKSIQASDLFTSTSFMNNQNSITLKANGDFLNDLTGEQIWDNGVTLSAKSADGIPAVVTYGWDGIAVGSDRYRHQIDYNPITKSSEQLVIDFNTSVTGAHIELGRMEIAEYNGLPETGYWRAYSADGSPVASGALDPRNAVSTGTDSYRFNIEADQSFEQLVIEATAYDNGKVEKATTNSSDFNLVEVTFTPSAEPVISPIFSSGELRTLKASGDFLDGSLGEQLWGDDVTIKAKAIDGAAAAVNFGWGGLAALGGRDDNQLEYSGESQSSEQLIVDFNGAVTQASIELGRLNKSEYDGAGETGRWTAYAADGSEVGTGILDSNSNSAVELGRGRHRFDIATNAAFEELVIEATGYNNGEGDQKTGNNSDFNLRAVTYARVGEVTPPVIPPTPPTTTPITPPTTPPTPPTTTPIIPPTTTPIIPPTTTPTTPPTTTPTTPPTTTPTTPPATPIPSGERISLTASASVLDEGKLVQNWGESVKLSAVDFNGKAAQVVYDKQFRDEGFGVSSDDDRWNQIDFYQNRGSEKLSIEFDTLVNNATLTVGMLGLNEGRQGNDETGKWTALNAQGEKIASGDIGPDVSALGEDQKIDGSYGKYPIEIATATPFAELVIEAVGFGYGQGEPRQQDYGENNSDFNVVALSFDPIPGTQGSF